MYCVNIPCPVTPLQNKSRNKKSKTILLLLKAISHVIQMKINLF